MFQRFRRISSIIGTIFALLGVPAIDSVRDTLPTPPPTASSQHVSSDHGPLDQPTDIQLSQPDDQVVLPPMPHFSQTGWLNDEPFTPSGANTAPGPTDDQSGPNDSTPTPTGPYRLSTRTLEFGRGYNVPDGAYSTPVVPPGGQQLAYNGPLPGAATGPGFLGAMPLLASPFLWSGGGNGPSSTPPPPVTGNPTYPTYPTATDPGTKPGGGEDPDKPPVTPVPEPGALAMLLGAGVPLGLLALRKRPKGR